MPTKSKTFKIITGSALALAVVLAGGASINAAVSTTSGVTHVNPMDTLVTALATKFNLNVSDVQKVFDDNRAQMEAQHVANNTTRLAQAVTDGKLTQTQSDLIVAKQKELQASREADRASSTALTQAERKTKMEAERAALSTWMTANNIPKEFMMMGGGKGHGGPKGNR